MRLLFYTAAAVFLMLAGIFVFYALKSPDQGSARVVLSIDAKEAPATQLALSKDARLDPVADARPQSPDGQFTHDTDNSRESEISATGAAERDRDPDRLSSLQGIDNQGTLRGGTYPDESSADTPQSSDTADAPKDGDTAENSENAPDAETDHSATAGQNDSVVVEGDTPPPDSLASSPQPDSSSSDSSSVPYEIPGTTLSGIDQDRPDRAGAGESGLNASVNADNAETAKNNQQIETVLADPIDAPSNEPRDIAPGPVENQQLTAISDGGPAREPAGLSRPDPNTQGHDTQQSGDNAAEPQPASNETPSGDPNADAKLRKQFDAFLASLKEKQQQDTSALAAVDPPPVPRRRPGDIPKAVRTAALDGGNDTSYAAGKSKAVSGTPRVALVLRGVGRNERNSSAAVTNLPSAVSMAFMPYGGPAQEWSRKARELGHEVIIQLPLEPSDYPTNNPGPETLLVASGADENRIRMRTILGRFEGYTGVTNFLGGRLLQSKEALRPILEDLKAQGLVYIGEGNGSHAVLRGIAGEIGLRYGGADVVIDANPNPEAIQKALDRLIAVARKQGSAIGIGFASQNTIEQVRAWSQTVSGKGVTLVPVGALASTPGAS